jgi:hypothetical protein
MVERRGDHPIVTRLLDDMWSGAGLSLATTNSYAR